MSFVYPNCFNRMSSTVLLKAAGPQNPMRVSSEGSGNPHCLIMSAVNLPLKPPHSPSLSSLCLVKVWKILNLSELL